MSERSPTGAPITPAMQSNPRDSAICPDCLPLVRRMEARQSELDSQLKAESLDVETSTRLMVAWLEVLHWATEARTHCIRTHGGGPW